MLESKNGTQIPNVWKRFRVLSCSEIGITYKVFVRCTTGAKTSFVTSRARTLFSPYCFLIYVQTRAFCNLGIVYAIGIGIYHYRCVSTQNEMKEQGREYLSALSKYRTTCRLC